MKTVLVLHKKGLDTRKFESLYDWMQKMGSIAEVAECDKKLKEVILKYDFV